MNPVSRMGCLEGLGSAASFHDDAGGGGGIGPVGDVIALVWGGGMGRCDGVGIVG